MASLALPAVLTMAEARATLARLEPEIAAQADPVVDASGLVTLDSAAVSVLLACRRAAAAAGKPLRIEGAPAKLAALARLYGVSELLFGA